MGERRKERAWKENRGTARDRDGEIERYREKRVSEREREIS